MKVLTKGHKIQRKLKKRITLVGLQKEVDELRTKIFGLITDDEGEYRPEFIKRIRKAAKEKPVHEFTDAKSFLAMLKKV